MSAVETKLSSKPNSTNSLVADSLPNVRRTVGTQESDETTVELADLVKDRSEIEAVWNRGFDVYPARFQCYLTNPAGVGSIWVSRPKTGPIFGAIGLHTRRMRVDDRVLPAGQIGNLAVDSEYRTAGPALRLQRTLLASLPGSDSAFIFGATAKAIQILRRVGGQPVGTAQRWTKVLRSETQLIKNVRSALLAKLIAPLVDLGMRLFSRETYSRRPIGMTCGITHTFDSRFDQLWCQAAVPFAIATERTSNYLTWRFQQRQATPYQIFCLSQQNDELAGYVVFQVCPNNVVEISDLFVNKQQTLGLLLNEFLRRMRSREFRATAVSMTYFGWPQLAEQLRAFGFLQRPEAMQILTVPNEASLGISPATRQLDQSQWFLTRSDLDLDLDL